MPLAIEPLHPMQAAERACINTLEQVLDICDALDPGRTGAVGVAVDIYHCWWDPKLEGQIARAGAKRLLAYHVCDWLVPTRDLLNDRGRRLYGSRRGRDLLRPLVGPPRRRGPRRLHRALQHGRVGLSSRNFAKRNIRDPGTSGILSALGPGSSADALGRDDN